MITKPFELYDAVTDGARSDELVQAAISGERWSLIDTQSSTGIAMATSGDSIEPMYPQGFAGETLTRCAQALKSWNLGEASLALAAANAFYNTEENMKRLDAYEPYENYSTAGIDFNGKTVGLVGHMHGPAGMRESAEKVYIIERSPKPGDYPDSACDYILPQCDIVIITGSTLINKTLPHLLELCRNAFTILTGPSVPMCPALLDFGIDRLAGMIVQGRQSMLMGVRQNAVGSPYSLGKTFLLKR